LKGTKVAWVVYHKSVPFDRRVVGVQQFKNADEVNLKIWPIVSATAALDDGVGLQEKIKVGEIYDDGIVGELPADDNLEHPEDGKIREDKKDHTSYS